MKCLLVSLESEKELYKAINTEKSLFFKGDIVILLTYSTVLYTSKYYPLKFTVLYLIYFSIDLFKIYLVNVRVLILKYQCDKHFLQKEI